MMSSVPSGFGVLGLDHGDGAEGAAAPDAARGGLEFVGVEDLVGAAEARHEEDAVLAHPVRAPDDDVAVAELPPRREAEVRGDRDGAVVGHDALVGTSALA
jgi:hypothetical protein